LIDGNYLLRTSLIWSNTSSISASYSFAQHIQPNNKDSTLMAYVVQGRNLRVGNGLFYIDR
jgi:hypothetical protein